MTKSNSPLRFDIYSGSDLVRTETLESEIIKIGKLASSDIYLDDMSVSRMHAVIEIAPTGSISIVDLGSASGTIVNGNKINKATLTLGDEITIGNFRLVMTSAAEEAEAPVVAPSEALTEEQSEVAAQVSAPASAAASARPMSANPFTARTSSGTETEDYSHGIVASGAPVRAHEVETEERAVEVMVLWGERSVLHVEHLAPPRDFYVGEPEGDEGVDFVIARESIGVSRLPVCTSVGEGVSVVIPEGASGEISAHGKKRSVELMRGQGELRPSGSLAGAMEYSLPEKGSARIKQGEFTFVVRDVKAGKIVAGAQRPDPKPIMYIGFSALLTGLMLVGFYFMPPRPRGLSSDLLDEDSRLVQFLMKADALEEQKPEWMKNADASGGGTGTAHEGDVGQLGDQEAAKSNKKYGIEGPKDNKDPQMARERALKEARTAGILGTLAGMRGAFNSPTSPFGADRALGNDPMSALGAMTGADIGANFGFGGLGLKGTGRGGGGTGQGTIGMGKFGTIGRGGGRGSGQGGVGGGVGGFAGRSSGVPRVRPGGEVSKYGSLSKEVIQRVVRQHKNEVKFCYEQQLGFQPDLAGRVSIKFVISPTGSVQSALVAKSELGGQAGSAASQCIARAVRRWVFPAPDGGGIVVVTYPFMLDAAGG